MIKILDLNCLTFTCCSFNSSEGEVGGFLGCDFCLQMNLAMIVRLHHGIFVLFSMQS